LTNPGNLQIGTGASTPGNLTVTGTLNLTNQNPGTDTSITNNLFNIYGYGSNLEFGWSGTNAMTLDKYKNLTVGGTVTSKNSIDIMNNIGTSTNFTRLSSDNSKLKIASNESGKTTFTIDKDGNSTATGTGKFGVGDIRIVNTGNEKMKPAVQLGSNLYLGEYETTAWDVVHSSSTAGLLLNAKSENVRVWSSNFNVDKNLTVSGSTTVTGSIDATGHSFHDRSNRNNRFEWYSNGGTARLWYNAVDDNPTKKVANSKHNENIFNIDYFGNANVTGSLSVNNGASFTGNINARTDGYNTRIGGIWTAPGIYAEDGKNLEIGAASNNVFIGPANSSAQNHLTVTGVAHDEADKVLIMNWQYHGNCLHSQNSNDLTLSPCDTNNPLMYWVVKTGRIVHANSKKCLTNTLPSVWNAGRSDQFKLEACDRKNGNQYITYNPYESKFLFRDPSPTRGNIVNRLRGQNGVIDVYDNRCGEDCVWVFK
jgi:hypothetical protein